MKNSEGKKKVCIVRNERSDIGYIIKSFVPK